MSGAPSLLSRTNLAPRPVLDDLTVLIPTVGRAILEQSLCYIVRGSGWPAQLIVVDQSSSPTVAAWLAQLRALGLAAEHVPSRQRGKAAALNRGIERVKTRFVAITDDDCFVAPNWLEMMSTHLRRSPEAIISGPAWPAGDESPVATVTMRTAVTSRRPGLRFASFCGSNMGAALGVILRVGLFDEDPCLVAAEDCEWSYRALRFGVPIAYTPTVAVRHFGWRDAGQRASRYRAYAHSLGGFYGKYLRRGDWLIALRVVMALLRALRRRVRSFLTGHQTLPISEGAYVHELVLGIIAGWQRGRLS